MTPEWVSAAIAGAGALVSVGAHLQTLRTVNGRVDKHDQDLYHGDARKPGLTTRMEKAEGDIEELRGVRGIPGWHRS
jgi:hypothetical protein